MDELAQPAIEVVERDEVRIAPAQWKRVYLDWMREIRPWCISRQLWWGHRIPVWYCDACEETIVAEERAGALRRLRRRAAPGGGRARHLVQLGDLALRDPRLARRHPRAARLLPDQLPHHRARDPLPLGGADDHDRARVPRRRPLPRRLRPLGDPGPRRAADVEEPRHRDRPAGGDRRPRRRRAALRPAGDVLDPGRALLRRQGPAGPRPRQQALEREPADPACNSRPRSRPAPRPTLHVEDRWILSRLERTIASVTEKLETYDFAHAVQEAYSFFWRDLCDWYLEIVKPRLYDGEAEVSATLLWALERVLALLHPTMPFVTEEIWTTTRRARGHLAVHPFPVADESLFDEAAEADVEGGIGLTQRLRAWRDLVDVPAATRRWRRVSTGSSRRSSSPASPASSSAATAPTRSPRSGRCGCWPPTQLDADAVAERLETRREELRAEVERGERKLGNEGFVAKAPAEVVEEERGKLERYRAELEELSRIATTATPTSTRWSRSAGGSASSGCTS